MADIYTSHLFGNKGDSDSEGSFNNITVLVFAAIGALFLSAKIFSFVRLVASLSVLPGKSLRTFGPKGSWALITGASDGIGREYALQLAAKSYNILLVSRTLSKLDAVASEVKQRNPAVQTKTFAMDFVRNNDIDYTNLKREIDGLDISILINCAGRSHDIPVPFAQTSEEEVKAIIATNCTGTLRVTQLVVPGMIKRKCGLILTMGSFAGLIPTPLLATYSGSKAFLQYWSTSLGSELAAHGITVELVQSYLVTSAMSKIRRPSLFVPNPRNYVRSVLGKIGRSGGAQGWAYTSTPFWGHALIQWAIQTYVGGVMGNLLVDRNRVMHEDIRKRALRKAEREAGKKVS
ncbi:hypothetical protein MMC25_007468 [Agyrium rufum]|nr:hypothetical protein [Agyrium rufum]